MNGKNNKYGQMFVHQGQSRQKTRHQQNMLVANNNKRRCQINTL